MKVSLTATTATQQEFQLLLQQALAQMGEGTPAEGYPNAGYTTHNGAQLSWHRY